MEDQLEVGENLTASLINSKLGRYSDDKFAPDVDFKTDIGPLSRKMIAYTGFEPNI